MAPAESGTEKRFVISGQDSDPSRQALEIYHLSHDLRGPLNSVLGFAELMLEGVEGPLTEHQEADITAIYQSAQNLLRLINAVVDLSKLEADRLKLQFGSVDLHQTVQNVLSTEFGSNKPAQVELSANLPEALPSLHGDQERIEQMLLSLIRFGFKMQKTGTITLSASRDDQAVTIEVGLAGVTLSPEQIDELFELVVHVDEAGRSELGLGGLALPLTQALAEKQNGKVWVESEEGSGTTFYLRLPVGGK